MSIITPTNQEELIEHCKRKIGYPVVKPSITDEQYNIRVKEAIDFFTDYHLDATEYRVYVQKILQENIDTKIFTPPIEVHEVVNVLTYEGNLTSVGSEYSIDMQNNQTGTTNYLGFGGVGGGMYGSYSSPLIAWYLISERDSFRRSIMSPAPRFDWNSETRHLYILEDSLVVDDYIAYECIVSHGDVWKNEWLIRYTSELFKLQWGINLNFYKNVQFPGGIEIDSQSMIDNAEEKIRALKEEMYLNYTKYPAILIG